MSNSDRSAGEHVPIEAAGGLLWRPRRQGPKLAVIHRPKRRDWSLPKGKLEPGETFPEAALREVAEETGCRARLGELAGYTLYEVKHRLKLVLFWHMIADEVPSFEPNDEVDALEWLTPDEAVDRLDHPDERRLVERSSAALGVNGRQGLAGGRGKGPARC